MTNFPHPPADMAVGSPANGWFFSVDMPSGAVTARVTAATALEFAERMRDFGYRAEVAFPFPSNANRTSWSIVPVAGKADMHSKLKADMVAGVVLEQRFEMTDSLEGVGKTIAAHVRALREGHRQAWRQTVEAKMAQGVCSRPRADRVDDMACGVAIVGR